MHPNGHSSSICNSQDKEAWKQPKCLLTRMDKEVVIYIYMCVCMYMYICIYNRILLSHKKEWNNDICGKTDGPRNCYSKWSKSEKGKFHMTSHMWNLKNGTHEFNYKVEIHSQKTILYLPKGKGGRGGIN